MSNSNSKKFAAGLVYCIASGQVGGYDIANGLASNGFGEHSPGGFSMYASFITEFLLTFFFLFVILGVTSPKSGSIASAPVAIGLALTLIHLIGIPVTNLSVNPARSLGPAVYVGGWAMAQVWLFWLAPIGGAVVAGLMYRFFFDCEKSK